MRVCQFRHNCIFNFVFLMIHIRKMQLTGLEPVRARLTRSLVLRVCQFRHNCMNVLYLTHSFNIARHLLLVKTNFVKTSTFFILPLKLPLLLTLCSLLQWNHLPMHLLNLLLLNLPEQLYPSDNQEPFPLLHRISDRSLNIWS